MDIKSKYLIIFDYDGVNSIAVSWGYHPKEKLLQASPGHMVSAPEDIMAIVL